MRGMIVHDGFRFPHGGAASGSVVERALRLARTWQARAIARRHLSELDDRLLADIGMDRAGAVDEAAKPFWRA